MQLNRVTAAKDGVTSMLFNWVGVRETMQSRCVIMNLYCQHSVCISKMYTVIVYFRVVYCSALDRNLYCCHKLYCLCFCVEVVFEYSINLHTLYVLSYCNLSASRDWSRDSRDALLCVVYCATLYVWTYSATLYEMTSLPLYKALMQNTSVYKKAYYKYACLSILFCFIFLRRKLFIYFTVIICRTL